MKTTYHGQGNMYTCNHSISAISISLLKEHGSTGQEKNRIIKCIILIETSKNEEKKSTKGGIICTLNITLIVLLQLLKKNKFK